MSVIQAVILGLIEGLTAFLPVSSSGHLVLAGGLMGISDHITLSFCTVLKAGPLVVLILALWKEILRVLKTLLEILLDLLTNLKIFVTEGRNEEHADYHRILSGQFRSYSVQLLVSTIAACIIGRLLSGFTTRIASNFLVVAMGFFVTALMASVSYFSRKGNKGPLQAGIPDAALVGVMEGISVIPGMSRQGVTYYTCRIAGFSRKFSLRYTFLSAVPVLAGALIAGGGGSFVSVFRSEGAGPVAAAMIVSGVVCFFFLKTASRLFGRKTCPFFAGYGILAGILSVVQYLH